MDNFDIKKAMPELYAPRRGHINTVTVPPLWFLMIDGQGDPNTSPEYQAGIDALYTLSYTIRFAVKAEMQRAYTVGPLEGLWWADDYAAFTSRDKDEWKWTIMIVQPDWITPEMVEAARAKALTKKPSAALEQVRFECFEEGLAVQLLHVGSYDDEAPVLADLHDRYLPEHNLVLRGLHHEIYLSDPRRVAPEKLRTILRQPVSVVEQHDRLDG